MTTGLKTPSSYYMKLINTFPPRPILTDGDLTATQARINQVLDNPSLNQDDRDYLKVLGMLVYEYEEVHEPIPALKGIELLQALLEEADLQPEDLNSILGDDVKITEILSHQKDLTVSHINKLAQFFHVSPESFLATPESPAA